MVFEGEEFGITDLISMSSISHSNESLVPDIQLNFLIYLEMPCLQIIPNHRPKKDGQVPPVMRNTHINHR